MDAETERKLCETITAICKEHLPFRHKFAVEGLLSIEIDDEEFVSIRLNDRAEKDSCIQIGQQEYEHRYSTDEKKPGRKQFDPFQRKIISGPDQVVCMENAPISEKLEQGGVCIGNEANTLDQIGNSREPIQSEYIVAMSGRPNMNRDSEKPVSSNNDYMPHVDAIKTENRQHNDHIAASTCSSGDFKVNEPVEASNATILKEAAGNVSHHDEVFINSKRMFGEGGAECMTDTFAVCQINVIEQEQIEMCMIEQGSAFKCTVCGKFFTKQSKLTDHQHSHNKLYSCTLCATKFRTKGDQIRHLKKQHSGDCACHVCSKIFRTKHLLARHEVEHGITYPCSLCSETFHSRLLYQQHELVHDGVTTNGSTNLNFCILCDKLFLNKTIFMEHLLWHKGDKSKCSFCRTYMSKKEYKSHIKIHKLQCDICDATFYNATKWKSHKATHAQRNHSNHHHTNKLTDKVSATDATMKNKYTCSKCGKHFMYERNMYSHCATLHPDEARKSYICPQYNKSFAEQRNVNRHNATVHSAGHKCPKCFIKCRSATSLKRHYTIKHSQTLKIKRFKCLKCDKRFTKKGDVGRHDKEMHCGPREKLYKCETCDRSYTEYRYLRRHVSEIHPVQPRKKSECNICGAKVIDLNRHLRRHTLSRYKCQICGSFVLNLDEHLMSHISNPRYKSLNSSPQT